MCKDTGRNSKLSKKENDQLLNKAGWSNSSTWSILLGTGTLSKDALEASSSTSASCKTFKDVGMLNAFATAGERFGQVLVYLRTGYSSARCLTPGADYTKKVFFKPDTTVVILELQALLSFPAAVVAQDTTVEVQESSDCLQPEGQYQPPAQGETQSSAEPSLPFAGSDQLKGIM